MSYILLHLIKIYTSNIFFFNFCLKNSIMFSIPTPYFFNLSIFLKLYEIIEKFINSLYYGRFKKAITFREGNNIS